MNKEDIIKAEFKKILYSASDKTLDHIQYVMEHLELLDQFKELKTDAERKAFVSNVESRISK